MPQSVKQLAGRGLDVLIEKGLGSTCHIPDNAYETAGAVVAGRSADVFKKANVIVRLNRSSVKELKLMTKGAVHISFVDPFLDRDTIEAARSRGISLISMDLIPRSTYAQKMDALSSQASLAGYAAVMAAASRLNRIFPMMMTPAGTISPARVFIIGAGVAGLQAIATAQRLGARVEAFDTRAAVEEQVQSLGARFVKVKLGETGQTRNGYAKALSEDQLDAQRKVMAKHTAQADVVITTAKVFGRKAPLIITRDMLDGMKPGSIVVDLAVAAGGNVEGSVPDREKNINGVKVIGAGNLPSAVAINASEMYSANLTAFITEFIEPESKEFVLNPENGIIKECLLTHDGKIVNQRIKTG
jgi:NAD(P) transhydrogenase subunit alpha